MDFEYNNRFIIVKATGSRTHLDWDINRQFIDIQQYLLDFTAGHSVRFLMDFTITIENVRLKTWMN